MMGTVPVHLATAILGLIPDFAASRSHIQGLLHYQDSSSSTWGGVINPANLLAVFYVQSKCAFGGGGGGIHQLQGYRYFPVQNP